MATTTPNIGLTLPAGTEGWKRSVINGNFTILDTKIGAVGSTPLQDQITALSSQLATDWTGCANYKETIESSANAVLQSFGKLRTLSFQGVSRSHTEDEVLMTLPSEHRPIGGNNIYASGVVNGTPILIRLNGSNGQVALFLANSAGTGRIYFSMTWVAA